MVRRRTRATNKTVAAEKSVDDDNDQRHIFHGPNAVAITLPKDALLDEQYFASPKRKDCRIDCEKVFETCCNQTDDQVYSELKSNQHSDCKIKSERGGIYGRNIGVPLATRSQTRTIEHFFKANTASKSDNLKNESTDKQNIQNEQHAPANSSNKTNKVDIVSFKIRTQSLPNEQCDNSTMLPQRHLSIDDKDLQLQPHLFLDISEDTNDTENTGISEYSAPQNINTNFGSYRSSLRDSHSSQSSTTDNIFLQEPVLTLNVDKSPNQASSIKINKTLEIEPIFSSPPTITAVVLNGHFNRIVSMNGSPEKREDLKTTTNIIVLDNCFDLQLENDSSSCDSGVAFGRSILETDNIESPLTAATRRRKPATPHRIVCPSPIKVAPRNVSPSNHTLMGQPSLLPPRNIQTLKEQLSPRKSNRYMSATVPKTRRRLHQPKEHQAPYKSSTHQNDYKQENDIQEVQHNIRNEPDKHIDNENLEDATVPFFSVPSKMVSNANINLTSQLNKGHKTKNITTKQQIQAHQPKMKLHHLPQPLAATNGNRELSEFFPVRRSVRKTKTEVKEEIMRNIEKAISEERADGLKIAHFKNKGRGVVADRRFERGEFVVEYVGDLISMTEAAEREKMYALDENAGCYMYYFKHKNQQYCIDATLDTGKLGRLVNHSRNGNLSTKVVVVKQKPHLILLAKDDIEQGEELTYDYGDRSKESLLHHPWLAF